MEEIIWVIDQLSGVTNIFSTDRAFAALKEDGSVVTWGSSAMAILVISAVSVSSYLLVLVIFIRMIMHLLLLKKMAPLLLGEIHPEENSSGVSDQLSSGVSNIYSNDLHLQH